MSHTIIGTCDDPKLEILMIPVGFIFLKSGILFTVDEIAGPKVAFI